MNELDLKGRSAALLMFAVMVLLPFARWSALPMLLMLLAGCYMMARHWRHLAESPAARLLLGLWLCYWLPQLVSCLDAVKPEESWRSTLSAIRYPLVAVFVILSLNGSASQRLLWQLCTALVLFWCLDALFQSVVGFNVLGMQHSPERLNGIFGATNIKLGPVLAVMAPLVLEYARRHWPRWLPLVYLLLLAVIFIIGTRAAWVMYLVVTVCYLFLYARRQPRRWVRAGALVVALILGVGVTAYQISPRVQQRVDRSALLLQGDQAALDQALSNRLPIWKTALEMVRHHPVNGVGVRGFRYAYAEYADSNDPWVGFRFDTGAHHAHQLLLEVATETGFIGLLGLLWALVLAARHWLRLNPLQRDAARPYAIALFVMLFPINTHLAFYSTFWSLVFWWLIIAYTASAGSGEAGDE